MSTAAVIAYKGTANIVQSDGYPEHMIPALSWRTEEQIEELVNGPEIRFLGVEQDGDSFYRRYINKFGDHATVAATARRKYGADYSYTWTPDGWIAG